MNKKSCEVLDFPGPAIRATDRVGPDLDTFLAPRRVMMTARLTALLSIWQMRAASGDAEYCEPSAVLHAFVARNRDDYDALAAWIDGGSELSAVWRTCADELRAVLRT